MLVPAWIFLHHADFKSAEHVGSLFLHDGPSAGGGCLSGWSLGFGSLFCHIEHPTRDWLRIRVACKLGCRRRKSHKTYRSFGLPAAMGGLRRLSRESCAGLRPSKEYAKENGYGFHVPAKRWRAYDRRWQYWLRAVRVRWDLSSWLPSWRCMQVRLRISGHQHKLYPSWSLPQHPRPRERRSGKVQRRGEQLLLLGSNTYVDKEYLLHGVANKLKRKHLGHLRVLWVFCKHCWA